MVGCVPGCPTSMGGLWRLCGISIGQRDLPCASGMDLGRMASGQLWQTDIAQWIGVGKSDTSPFDILQEVYLQP